MGVSIELCWETLGVRDRFCVLAVALACVSYPASRLLEARGSVESLPAGTMATIAVAMIPWTLVALFHQWHPSWTIWQPLAFLPALRYGGAALALGLVIARPILTPTPPLLDGRTWTPSLNPQAELLMIGVLWASASAVLAGFALVWFVTRSISRLEVRSNAFRRSRGWSAASGTAPL